MKRLTALRNAVCAGSPLLSIRSMAVLSFLAALGALVAGEFHRPNLADFMGGLAVGFTAGLVLLVFSVDSAHAKDHPVENPLTELNLSR